ncbi:MAG: ECF transporter S component [Clostridia bacterium]|nr:ECF transporter S component [Clostridia bacterium]
MGKERIDPRILYVSELAILIAILLLMAFTPVGYLRLGTMTITFLTVPCIVGAIVLGPSAGAILGTVFGLTSFYQCFGMDPMGTALMQISLPRTFLFTVIPRLLMGLLVGLIFKAFKKRSAAAYTVTSFCGPLLNTLLFMTTLIACFWHTDVIQAWAASLPGATNIFLFVVLAVGVNFLVEAVVCTVLGAAVSKAVDRYVNKA